MRMWKSWLDYCPGWAGWETLADGSWDNFRLTVVSVGRTGGGAGRLCPPLWWRRWRDLGWGWRSMCWTAHRSQGWLSIMPRSLSNTDSQSLYYYYNTLISNQNTKRFYSHLVLLTQQSRPAPPMSQSNNNSYFYHLSKLSAIPNTESHKL